MTAEPAENDYPLYRRILCCTDFSDAALLAFKAAVAQARLREDSELILLHVIPEPEAQFWKTYIYEVDEDLDAKARQDIDAAIDETYRPLLPPGMAMDVQARIGKDYIEILEFARQQEIDLIVLGHQGHSRFTVFAGNVADKVVRHAPCPVLIITF